MKSRRDEAVGTVDLPVEAFHVHPLEPRELANSARSGCLTWCANDGHGKAAGLAGLPRAAFLCQMARHQISPFDFDEGELAAELAG